MRQKSHEMDANNTLWVLGHKITNFETTGDYDFAIGVTPALTDGPPPHMHEEYAESFFISEGEMEFVINGKLRKVKAGELVDLPPKVIHTFSNKNNSDCKWINIHSPKGFRDFFEFIGVSTEEPDAQIKSTTEEKIKAVIEKAPDFDMHIKI